MTLQQSSSDYSINRWLRPGGWTRDSLDPFDSDIEHGVMVTWSTDRQLALIDTELDLMVHAEPTQAASGNYSISTVRVREDDNDFSEWPGQIDAQVIMLAEDALDAIRRVLIADETHPYHGVVAGRAADRTELSVGIAAVRLIERVRGVSRT